MSEAEEGREGRAKGKRKKKWIRVGLPSVALRGALVLLFLLFGYDGWCLVRLGKDGKAEREAKTSMAGPFLFFLFSAIVVVLCHIWLSFFVYFTSFFFSF